MTEEDVSRWVARYRSTVTEEPTPDLDEVILATANRRAARVRTMRRTVVVLALAVVLTWPFWRADVGRAPAPDARNVSGYGREEGATRYYLMNVGRAHYTGPGTLERRP